MIPPTEEGEGAKLMVASGFQVKVLKNNEKCDHHILVDASPIIDSLDSDEKLKMQYKMILTISVYDIKTLQMMPIGHALG
jgi:hypothetical protein